jgi:predicted nucleic acid-binding Zn ribbon protein
MSSLVQPPDPLPKSERAAVGAAVIDSREVIPVCPICGKALTARQRSACSDRCRAALSRKQRAQALSERDQRLRALVTALARELDLTTRDAGEHGTCRT